MDAVKIRWAGEAVEIVRGLGACAPGDEFELPEILAEKYLALDGFEVAGKKPKAARAKGRAKGE